MAVEQHSRYAFTACTVWSTDLAFAHLQSLGQVDTKRTAERRLYELGLLPTALAASGLRNEFGHQPIRLVLFAQLKALPIGRDCLHFNDARGARYWLPLADAPNPAQIEK